MNIIKNILRFLAAVGLVILFIGFIVFSLAAGIWGIYTLCIMIVEGLSFEKLLLSVGGILLAILVIEA